jgi:hypothetical protein
MAFKYVTEGEPKDYLPLSQKGFDDVSNAFPFAYFDLENSQYLPKVALSPKPIYAGNIYHSSAIEDLSNAIEYLAIVLSKLGSVWGESSNRTRLLSGYRGTTAVMGSGYYIGQFLVEEEISPVSAVLGELYEQLSRITGPTATRDVRSRLLQKFSGMAEDSAPWLVRRLRDEQDIDAQESALSALAEIGEPALLHVVTELTKMVGTDDANHASLFLRALRGFRSTGLGPWVNIVFPLIASFSLSIYPEVREAAYRATVLLPKDQALKILHSAKSAEHDQDIREAVEDLIEHTQREQG